MELRGGQKQRGGVRGREQRGEGKVGRLGLVGQRVVRNSVGSVEGWGGSESVVQWVGNRGFVMGWGVGWGVGCGGPQNGEDAVSVNQVTRRDAPASPHL